MVPQKLWFECKVSFDAIDANSGKQVKKNETYVIDAFSFGEAENIALIEAQKLTDCERSVVSIKRAKFYEVFENNEAEAWYKAKVNFIILDVEKGKEKKVATTMLIQADDIESARVLLVEQMKSTMSDYEIANIGDTQIVEVIPWSTADGELVENE